jgi:16S rRNA (guanine(1405)-N(7))-methyltransferase
MSKNPAIEDLIEDIRSSAKYRRMNLPDSTLRDLLERELAVQPGPKAAVDAVRKKLHNIIAPYLGDADFPEAARLLENAFASGDASAVQGACASVLASHASTRERLSILDAFYPRLFELTGRPNTVLDLACGLNPFSFPWMGLPDGVHYHAYDIIPARVELINHYFSLQGLEPLAEVRDVLVSPPEIEADVAFLFKEAHRMEQRQRGCSRPFWQALRVRWLLVSLPPSNLTGRRDLVEKQRRLVAEALEGLPWRMVELMFANEMVFCVEKLT